MLHNEDNNSLPGADESADWEDAGSKQETSVDGRDQADKSPGESSNDSAQKDEATSQGVEQASLGSQKEPSESNEEKKDVKKYTEKEVEKIKGVLTDKVKELEEAKKEKEDEISRLRDQVGELTAMKAILEAFSGKYGVGPSLDIVTVAADMGKLQGQANKVPVLQEELRKKKEELRKKKEDLTEKENEYEKLKKQKESIEDEKKELDQKKQEFEKECESLKNANALSQKELESWKSLGGRIRSECLKNKEWFNDLWEELKAAALHNDPPSDSAILVFASLSELAAMERNPVAACFDWKKQLSDIGLVVANYMHQKKSAEVEVVNMLRNFAQAFRDSPEISKRKIALKVPDIGSDFNVDEVRHLKGGSVIAKIINWCVIDGNGVYGKAVVE